MGEGNKQGTFLPGISNRWAPERNEAEFNRARRTPRDDQENLYPKGLSEHSGAGRPPQ